ncbi:hypothetical protein TanjilG_14117 [Lupinus angustifolius]|uniref:Uncharacterized protein n=1 Tax=Lupinus angustifolius TaxID=3871 RepID=A0A1J7HY52_LUPAN|nr:hypothetical protein TanjilG_14117 [Lupinus angustifolius]
MDANLCDELTEKLSIQPSSLERKPEVNKCVDQVPYDADDKYKINIFADIIPILAHDIWCEKEQFQRLLLTKVGEERKWKVKEAELEHKLFWKRMQLDGCIKSLQDVQEQFDEYIDEVEPIEEPEWIHELLKDD